MRIKSRNAKVLPRRVALTQHFLAHYRQSIFNLLCRQKCPDPEYVLFADTISTEQIKVIDYSKAQIDPNEGGLHWEKINNTWFGKAFLWQTSLVRIALSSEFNTVIYLGDVHFLSAWCSAILARLCGKRVLMWTHGYLREEKNFKGWVREKFYRLADGLLLYGQRSRKFLLKRGFDPANLYVVYNSLDYDKQRNVREMTTRETLQKLKKELFGFPDFPTLVFVGRLTPQKKLFQIIEAAHLLKKGGVLINILFVGDGPEKASLKQAALQLGINDRVVFYGSSYSEEDLGPLLMLADICVAPGEIGLACMHAFAYGTPVITHDNFDRQMPEAEAVHPGKTGDFFKQNDVNDLARVIREWLNGNLSRDQIKKNCQRIIESYYNPAYQVKVINNAVAGIPASEFVPSAA